MYKIPVIFDVDTGLDDAMTLAMACATPEIDVRAVTCTFGNNDLHHTLRNTLNMLKLLGREDIPVAAGADEPLLRKRGAADEVEQGGKVVHGVDGLGGFRFPFPDATAALSEKNAVDLTYQVLMESKEPVVYCALGAHGNPGRLLQKYPEVKSKIKCFVNMGGYIRNGTLSPMSSVNIFYDPHGAAIMLESGIPFYMCPGDLTGHALITLEEMKELEGFQSPVGKAINYFLKEYYRTCSALGEDVIDGLRGQSLHDPCALDFIVHPEHFTYGRYYCRVETESELCTAMTVIDYEDTLHLPKEEKNLFFVDTVDREAFVSYFLDCIRSYEA